MPNILKLIVVLSLALRLGALEQGGHCHGFLAEHVYLAAGGQIGGWHLVHESGVKLDLIPMDTAPQAFVSIGTHPVGDGGEPHTLEHLLLGKGRKGFSVAGREAFRLIESSAYTDQLKTVYHFSSGLGVDEFLVDLEIRLDALLHPDFSDEEIRREVAHVGVKETPQGLELEETGTVYTEMISSWDHPWSRAAYRLQTWLYGPGHPQAGNAGGIPAAIRELKPEDIRAFHTSNHFLANMQLVLVLPMRASPEDLCSRLDRLLKRLEPEAPALPTQGLSDLPSFAGLTEARIEVLDVPAHAEGQPGLVLMAWPPNPLDLPARLRLELLLGAMAGGESSDFYTQLLGSDAEAPLGAAWVTAFMDADPGHVVWMAFGSMPEGRIGEKELKQLRERLLDRMHALSRMQRGDRDLEQLRSQMQASLKSMRREGRSLLDEPPGFGQRRGVSRLPDYLSELRETGEPRLDLERRALLDAIQEDLTLLDNPAGAWLALSGLLDHAPHIVGTRGTPELLTAKEESRERRLEDFQATLVANGEDAATALSRYHEQEQKIVRGLDESRKGLVQPDLPAQLPMTPDPVFPARELELGNGVPVLHGVFEQVSGTEAALALDISAEAWPLDASLEHWIGLLPALLTESGLRNDSLVMSYKDVERDLRGECRYAGCWIDTELREARAELVWYSSGSTSEECDRGFDWIQRFLRDADLGEENLPRLRELARRELAALGQRRQGGEESWVENPAQAWQHHNRPRLLHAGSFLTQQFDVFRAAWSLEDTSAGLPAAMQDLRSLADSSLTARDRTLDRLLAWAGSDAEYATAAPPALRDSVAWTAWREAAPRQLNMALQDLRSLGSELPADKRGNWLLLCSVIEEGALRPSREVLLELGQLVGELRGHAGRKRAWITGSTMSADRILPRLDSLNAAFGRERPAAGTMYMPDWTRNRPARDPIQDRQARVAGLMYDGLSSGVVIHVTPFAGIHSTTRDDLLDYLAARLYGGGGAHGLFMRTWGAGLAYSNGASASERHSQLRYYAERCPDVSQTLGFVEGVIREAPPVNDQLVQYALAGAFAHHDMARDFPERTRLMAKSRQLGGHDELTAFRQALDKLKDQPGLAAELDARLRPVMSAILPGLAVNNHGELPAGGFYFLIGPETQFDYYRSYLESAGVSQTPRILRPCDYWRF